PRQDFPASRDRRRDGLHGRARGGKVSRSAGGRRNDAGGRIGAPRRRGRESKYDGNGLGQVAGLSRRRRGGELHPCGRGAQSEPIGGQPADQRPRRKPQRPLIPPPRQPDLIQRHLVSVQEHVYASTEYLKKHGTPKTPDDLDEHRLIVYGDDSRPPVPGVNWLLDAGAKPGKERRPILSVNNSYG